MLQTIAGGSSDAEVASLLLWVFGWVGLAFISALLGPVWAWLDPFSTLHDVVAAVVRPIGCASRDAHPGTSAPEPGRRWC